MNAANAQRQQPIQRPADDHAGHRAANGHHDTAAPSSSQPCGCSHASTRGVSSTQANHPPAMPNASHGNGGAACFLVSGSQQQRRQRRAERQRIERRNDRRDRNRERKLPEELPRDAADERARHEHGAEHQADGDHRAGDLLHRLDRGFARRQAVFDVMLDRLDHHDRVVDHDADRQHQSEQRQVIQAEAEHRHRRERADDRHRHGDQRNDRRSPVLQKHQHHDGHQDDRVAQRLETLR